jgi:DNA polymerase-1
MNAHYDYVIVDLDHVFYRNYYQLNYSKKNLEFGALFGSVRSLNMIREKFRDSKCFVASGISKIEDTRQRKLLPDYKAHRKPLPEEIWEQRLALSLFARYMGLHCAYLPYETDDIIGILTSYWRSRKHSVLVVSGDHDMFQLVSKRIKVYDPIKKVLWDSTDVFNKIQVYANEIPIYKTFVGDSSDNIKGISGMGPKKSEIIIALLRASKGNMIKKFPKILGKVKKLIEDNYKNISVDVKRLSNNYEAIKLLKFKDLNVKERRAIKKIISSEVKQNKIELKKIIKKFGMNSLLSLLEE